MFGHPSLDSAGHPFLHQNVGGIVDAQQSGSIFSMKGILHVSLKNPRVIQNKQKNKLFLARCLWRHNQNTTTVTNMYLHINLENMYIYTCIFITNE